MSGRRAAGCAPGPPPRSALAAPLRRRQLDLAPKQQKKGIPGGGVRRKEGIAEGEVRGGEREGGREEKLAGELGKLHRTSVRPGWAGTARLRPPAAWSAAAGGLRLLLAAFLLALAFPRSLGSGSEGGGRNSPGSPASPPRGETPLTRGAERRRSRSRRRSRRLALPPGFCHPPAFPMTQVTENSESLQSEGLRGGCQSQDPGEGIEEGCRESSRRPPPIPLPFHPFPGETG